MKSKLVVVLVVVSVLIACCVCTGILVHFADEQQASFAPLAAACDGRPVAGAAPYTRGTGPMTAFFERSVNGWRTSTGHVPSAQRADGVADASLVACAPEAPKRNVVDTCCFEHTVVGIGVPGTETCFPRVRMSRRVRVHVATTGRLLADREILGPEPRDCDDWVGRAPHADDFVGSDPDEDELGPFFTDPEAPEETPSATPDEAAHASPKPLPDAATGGKHAR